MVQKCYNKPNRTKKRTFSTCDAARIAREVVRDEPEATPETVLACIAKGFGFTHISLSRIRMVESGIGLGKVPIKPAVIILEKALIKLSKIDLFKKALGPILIAVKKIIDLADKIDTIDPPQKEVDDVIDKERCKCKDQPKLIERK